MSLCLWIVHSLRLAVELLLAEVVLLSKYCHVSPSICPWEWGLTESSGSQRWELQEGRIQKSCPSHGLAPSNSGRLYKVPLPPWDQHAFTTSSHTNMWKRVNPEFLCWNSYLLSAWNCGFISIVFYGSIVTFNSPWIEVVSFSTFAMSLVILAVCFSFLWLAEAYLQIFPV